ncbi:MAG: hypothetical protein KIS66_13810 [Fimbriimonadaceae bacterium]|nr:hypothetical protein [Fimbriimonadaceae bacterium]
MSRVLDTLTGFVAADVALAWTDLSRCFVGTRRRGSQETLPFAVVRLASVRYNEGEGGTLTTDLQTYEFEVALFLSTADSYAVSSGIEAAKVRRANQLIEKLMDTVEYHSAAFNPRILEVDFEEQGDDPGEPVCEVRVRFAVDYDTAAVV